MSDANTHTRKLTLKHSPSIAHSNSLPPPPPPKMGGAPVVEGSNPTPMKDSTTESIGKDTLMRDTSPPTGPSMGGIYNFDATKEVNTVLLSKSSCTAEKSAAILWWAEYHRQQVQKPDDKTVVKAIASLNLVIKQTCDYAGSRWDGRKVEEAIGHRVLAIAEQALAVVGPRKGQNLVLYIKRLAGTLNVPITHAAPSTPSTKSKTPVNLFKTTTKKPTRAPILAASGSKTLSLPAAGTGTVVPPAIPSPVASPAVIPFASAASPPQPLHERSFDMLTMSFNFMPGMSFKSIIDDTAFDREFSCRRRAAAMIWWSEYYHQQLTNTSGTELRISAVGFGKTLWEIWYYAFNETDVWDTSKADIEVGHRVNNSTQLAFKQLMSKPEASNAVDIMAVRDLAKFLDDYITKPDEARAKLDRAEQKRDAGLAALHAKHNPEAAKQAQEKAYGERAWKEAQALRLAEQDARQECLGTKRAKEIEARDKEAEKQERIDATKAERERQEKIRTDAAMAAIAALKLF